MATLKQLITTHCKGMTDYEAIAAKLNAPTVMENPHAGRVDVVTSPAPITMDAITSLVPPAEAAVIYVKAQGLIANMQQAIDAGNRAWLSYLLQTAASSSIGALTEPTIAALTELLQATVTTETTQPATIPGPSLAAAAGLGTVTSAQIQQAMN